MWNLESSEQSTRHSGSSIVWLHGKISRGWPASHVTYNHVLYMEARNIGCEISGFWLSWILFKIVRSSCMAWTSATWSLFSKAFVSLSSPMSKSDSTSEVSESFEYSAAVC